MSGSRDKVVGLIGRKRVCLGGVLLGMAALCGGPVQGESSDQGPSARETETRAANDGTPQALTPEERQRLSRYFGFGPLEVYRLEPAVGRPVPADFNADGLTDLAISNNRKSVIEILLQRRERVAEASAVEAAGARAPGSGLAQANDLTDDWRFERRPVSVNYSVECLVVADVTGDGKADLITFGNPAELVVLAGRGDGTFEPPVTQRVRDGLATTACCDAGDVDGDGRADVVLLGKNDVLVFRQWTEGGLAPPVRLPHSAQNPFAVRIADINGDGRKDVILATDDPLTPLFVRYQDAGGHLGPMTGIRLPQTRSARLATVLGNPQADLLGVERISGRLKRWTFRQETDLKNVQDRAVYRYAVPGGGESQRVPVAVGDVNGNGRLDLVTANVEAAQLVLMAQQADGALGSGTAFGGQVKMRDLRCFRSSGDGADRVYTLSTEEETIAVSTYEDGRLSFPQPIPTTGKPYAFDIGPLGADGRAYVAYASRGSEPGYQLVIAPLDSTGADPLTLEIVGVDEPPTAVRLADVNQDGLQDVLVFVPYAPLATFVQIPGDKGPEFRPLGRDASAQAGLVKQAAIEGFAMTDVDGDGKAEVLLAQKRFVRALRVTSGGTWDVVDQINPPGADAEITGVAAVAIPGHRRSAVAMYDRRSQEVHVYLPDGETSFAFDRSIAVGNFQLQTMLAARLSESPAPNLLLADGRQMALVMLDRGPIQAVERGVYESSLKDARLSAIAVGDVNGDGITDVAVLDTENQFVEILTFEPDESLVRATRFRVFSQRQYSDRYGESGEPRWVELIDVTHDGIADLLIIAHDRLLVYPGQ